MTTKILPIHHQRTAVVYLRQSTLRQVVDHPESTRRQYDLRERARQLGWPEASIDVIDEDLGRSGTDAAQRTGFRRLCDQVARGHVGAIFALEVSRLSRSSADWYRLLDLCGVTDVLLIDEQAVFHPADPNDRLLLGIKGTMSEAERAWIQLRLRGARMSKARRGEFRIPPPAGYLWDRTSSRLRLDPDEQVQSAIRLVFERMRADQSAHAVMRYFVRHGLRLPSRGPGGASLRWVDPRPSRVLAILHNPTYAGVYVYGRRACRVEVVDGAPARVSARVPPQDWEIVHRDRHPAYLGWEEFLANRRALDANRPSREGTERRGAPRKGGALLQGLVLCGKCGHRMHVAFGGRQGARYACSSPVQQGRSTSVCWSVRARGIDALVADQFLAAVSPPALELSLAAVELATREAASVERQWALRLERARFDVSLAERRYKAVDPENRTVARTLEAQWEQALRVLRELEAEQRALLERLRLTLTDADRARIDALSADVPALWSAATTSPAQRKTMLRVLVEYVCLRPLESGAGIGVKVQWRTGAITEHVAEKPRFGGREAPPRAQAMIRTMVAAMARAQAIARALNEAGLTTGAGNRWTKTLVHQWCYHHEVTWPEPVPTSSAVPDRREDGAYSLRGLTKLLRVTEPTLRYWIKQGWLVGEERGGPGNAWWFRIDAATLVRLRRTRAAHLRPRGKRPPLE
ncbi:MAG TPA: recombinase family protein [Polyangiaceae bacterium]|nr:recombinase family protein [Polyangiaceae bacterium]